MKILIAVTLLLLHTLAWAAPMDAYEFESREQEKTFQKLNDELRCLVCQNQSIAESNADLAKDLRAEIYGMLQAGKSEAQIKEFMVDRYGDYVLYEPPFKPMTWLLWIGPIIIFFIGLIYARRFIFQQNAAQAPQELSAEEAERLKNLQLELNAAEPRAGGDKADKKRDKKS